MVGGFNHNFRYKGEVYHIQTEDSGLKSPNIVTLLYQGGTILASKKTSYADITKVDNLEHVVEELMKEQHKDMLRNLKSGGFDAVIDRFQSSRKTAPQPVERGVETLPPAAEKPAAAVPPVPPTAASTAPAATVSQNQQKQAPGAAPKPSSPVSAVPAAKMPPASVELSLDEVIITYLMGDDK